VRETIIKRRLKYPSPEGRWSFFFVVFADLADVSPEIFFILRKSGGM
jgi:hypothetical protein